jgi:hypothetical protein
MANNKKSVTWMAIGGDLLECLKTKGRQRHSRYDAFVWLIEHINAGISVYDDMDRLVGRKDYMTNFTRLAEEWNWSRDTVQLFVDELVHLSVINAKRQGHSIVLTLGCKSCQQLVL